MEPHFNHDTGELRRRAESTLRRAVRRSLPKLPPESVEALVHELHVHEIELQIQCDELQKAHLEAEESYSRYRELYESIPVGYVTVDMAGRIHDLNPAGASLLGVERNSVHARYLLSFFNNGDADACLRLCKDVAAARRTMTRQLPMLRRDRTRFWASLHAAPVLEGTPAGARVRIAFTDITAQKEAEELLRRHEAELEARGAELEVLTGKLFAAQEDERKRIARDIHDDHCQRVTALILEARSLVKYSERHAPAIAPRVTRMAEQLSQILRDFRTLSHELHPRNLDDLSLATSARRLLDEVGEQAQFTTAFHEVDVPEKLPSTLTTCLYRLLQENLTNISKHAAATHVDVSLKGSGDAIHLTISDNGQGFNAEAVLRDRRGIGLVGMQERIRPLNGTVRVDSRPGMGTTVSVSVPMLRGTECRDAAPWSMTA